MYWNLDRRDFDFRCFFQWQFEIKIRGLIMWKRCERVAVSLRPGAPLSAAAPFVLVHACMVLKPARLPALPCSTAHSPTRKGRCFNEYTCRLFKSWYSQFVRCKVRCCGWGSSPACSLAPSLSKPRTLAGITTLHQQKVAWLQHSLHLV